MTNIEKRLFNAIKTNNFVTIIRDPKFYTFVAKYFKDSTGWFDGCVVHHIDENPCNNHPSNLQCMTRKDHSSMHKISIKRIKKELRTIDRKYEKYFS